MAEQIDLVAPETKPSITSFKVIGINLDWESKRITITLKSNTGEGRTFEYEDQDAVNKMTALNKANLQTKSLQRRIIEQLVADGKIAGNISGAVD